MYDFHHSEGRDMLASTRGISTDSPGRVKKGQLFGSFDCYLMAFILRKDPVMPKCLWGHHVVSCAFVDDPRTGISKVCTWLLAKFV
ncbi:hypothetical protein OFN94_29840, partial [Escherichia coli]|nr:hypothetical protein [Escherichia coli]